MWRPQCYHALLICCTILNVEPSFDLNIRLSSDDVRGKLHHFWRSTGFCPPKDHQDAATFDLSRDMHLNLAYIGAIPSNGIRQVRVHWLLDLVKVISVSAQYGPQYNFTFLDAFVDLLALNSLSPGFELMGNPSDIFTDLENQTQVFWWKDLVTQTAKRYVSKYGLKIVSEWNFETWNEPDCHDFDRLKMTVQGFLNYYDACSEGLKAVEESLRLGGPADGCNQISWDKNTVYKFEKSSLYADALLSHVTRGKNYFTGETGVRIDFISFHEKGEGRGVMVLEKEIRQVDRLKSLFPGIASKPFYNDEADPLVTWSRDEVWRANAVYAALVAKIISQHQNILMSRADHAPIPNYHLLSNDNGFLSYYPHQFTQRTLLARFQMNDTSPPYVTFEPKPVYVVMALLTFLGDRQVHVDVSKNTGEPMLNTSDFGVLASLHSPNKGDNSSSDSWQMTILLYGASDPGYPTDYALVNLNWTVSPPPDIKSMKLCVYTLNNEASNPYAVWSGLFNKTAFPTLKQFQQMRQQEDPHAVIYDVPLAYSKSKSKRRRIQVPIPPGFQLLDPHVAVLHLCAMSTLIPEQVTGVRLITVTRGQVLLVWSNKNIATKCLLTYEVEWSSNGKAGSYVKVNTRNSIINRFLFETDSDRKVFGFYRVRAVDYWNRGGVYSHPMQYEGQSR